MAGTQKHRSLAGDEPSNPPIFWQAGMPLTGIGTVDSLCDVACGISERVDADRIRVSPEVVVAPVTVPPSSA